MFSEAEYLTWAKAHSGKAPRPLSWSNVPALTREDLVALGIDPSSPELGYGPSGIDGGGPLRERIAARRGVKEDQVLVALGTTGANFAVLAANQDGRTGSPVALVETPVYTPLVRTLESLGYRIARFERPRGQGYGVDLDLVKKAWTRDVAVVVLTSLHNPTGAAVPGEALAALARRCEQGGALLLSDEVYREFVDEAVAPPAHPLSPWACSTESLSKAFGLAELRIGWAIGSPSLIARARRILDHVSGDPPTPARALAARALERWDAIVARARAIAASNGELVARFVEGRPDRLRWVRPPGGVHGLVEVLQEDADSFQERLLRDEGVLVVPGRFFEAKGTVRLGWGGAREKVEDALAAFGRALARRA
jgi:aspartate/methionine/tyrosine aminotransferase